MKLSELIKLLTAVKNRTISKLDFRRLYVYLNSITCNQEVIRYIANNKGLSKDFDEMVYNRFNCVHTFKTGRRLVSPF